MALKGGEEIMAKNIMDEMEAVGLNPRQAAALAERFYVPLSKALIKTINELGEVDVTGGGSYGGEKAKIL